MNVTGISVSFKGTIPTQAYGNIALDVTWQAELSSDDSPEQQTQNLFARIRGEVIAAVEPIAKARAKGMESALANLPQSEREKIMQTGGIFNFLGMIAPELAFAENSGRFPTVQEARSKIAAVQDAISGVMADLVAKAAVEPDPALRKLMTGIVDVLTGALEGGIETD